MALDLFYSSRLSKLQNIHTQHSLGYLPLDVASRKQDVIYNEILFYLPLLSTFFFDNIKTFKAFKTNNHFDLVAFLKELHFDLVVYKELFDRKSFLKLLYFCSKSFKNFYEFKNVLAHYHLYFEDVDNEISYNFSEVFEPVQEFYLKRKLSDMDDFLFVFDFFFKLDKILGFSFFPLIHRSFETKFMTTFMMRDLCFKYYKGKIKDENLIGISDKDNRYFESDDSKLYTREGLYLLDIFAILLFYFIFIVFEEF